MRDILLSIDCGTQSLRALLFSRHGVLLDKVQIHYEAYSSPKPGWAEQKPEIFWESLCEASNLLKKRCPEYFERIAGVGVTTQRDSMVNVDINGNPLRPVITWLDQRKAMPVYEPNAFLNFAFKCVGVNNALRKLQADAKCNWIMQNEPEIWEKTACYMQVSGFLNRRLTGRFKDSTASQIGHAPFNYRKAAWASENSLNFKLFPIERSKLPEVVLPGELIGEITNEASIVTGIPAGIPVIACGSDKGCETIGVGVLDTTMASLSFGTTATVQTTTDKYFEPIRFMPPYPAPIPGKYNPEVEIFRGYWMITWFKNEFGHKEMEKAAELGVTPEIILNDLLHESPPGAMGLMLQPYWGPGLEHPVAKGSMIGFGDVHKKPHVYRAVIEGLGYGLLDGLHKIEKASGRKVNYLAVSGGASQSDEICQTTADIFNLKLARGRTTEASGLGAAMITAVGLGFYKSFEDAITSMSAMDRVFVPDPARAKIYNKLYRRVYKKIFKALKPLYEEIREITGYPEKIR